MIEITIQEKCYFLKSFNKTTRPKGTALRTRTYEVSYLLEKLCFLLVLLFMDKLFSCMYQEL